MSDIGDALEDLFGALGDLIFAVIEIVPLWLAILLFVTAFTVFSFWACE